MLPSAARSQIVDGKKQCGLCREWFPIENFWKQRNASTGLFSACIPCATVRRNESYAKKPVPIEKSREYRARYRAKHPEKFKESHERQKLRKRGVTGPLQGVHVLEVVSAMQHGPTARAFRLLGRDEATVVAAIQGEMVLAA